VWRAQLGRIASEQLIPGLATTEARKKVDDIALKLGGDPDAYFFGAQPVSNLPNPAATRESL
jgi:hypothetical protein